MAGRGDEEARAILLEAFYYIVRPIAGKIATKRFPPPLAMTQVAYDGQRDRIHELASVGIFGLFVAADRFDRESGYRFSTCADKWVRN
jgi:DNA-directed RNA polymerase specialized sigma subunit